MSDSGSEDIEPTKLGTKEHWEEVYERELNVYTSSQGQDTGENWFDEHHAQSRMLRYLKERSSQGFTPARILDIGTGNGQLLLACLEIFPEAHGLGIDYAERSVAFCQQILQDQNLRNVTFQQCDWLECPDLGLFNLILDKGTLDAMILSDIPREEIIQGYLKSLSQVALNGAEFLVTSCNFTEQELLHVFQGQQQDLHFELIKSLEYPVMRFGGHQGQPITTLSFRISR